ncbi:MAG: TetR/AcrR family transcriptional regulator [Eggerthellaceae bacterium]|nr:TetR/AcrR family transcriptional regulator [Eggerthellaceae bacterium]
MADTAAPNRASREPFDEPASTRRDEFIAVARGFFEEKGLERTHISDITKSLGVTRSLFYHYFPDKDALVEAVLDDYVGDFVQMTHYWNEGRERGDIRGALQGCIAILRRGIFDKDQFRTDLATNENASLYIKFVHRAAEALGRYITETTVVDYAAHHQIHIDHVYETFYMLIVGMIGFMRRYPDASDELLEDLVAQTLRLDMSETYARQRRGGK